MSFRNSTCLSLTLLLVAALAGAALGQEGKIVLNGTAAIADSIVRLGDVAVIEVADADRRQELAGLQLMPSPGVGQTSYLTLNDVRAILVGRGFTATDMDVTGASRVRVEGVSPTTDTTASDTAEQRRSLRQAGRRATEANEYEGMTVAHVVRNVRRGEVLQPSDVELRPLTVMRQDDSYAPQLENVIGKETTRGLAADRPIAADDVRTPVIVRRNEVVTVFAHAGRVTVRREMLALGDAGRYELVEVQPLSPQYHGRARQVERFQTQVIGPGEAVVVTGNTQVHGSAMQITLGVQEINR